MIPASIAKGARRTALVLALALLLVGTRLTFPPVALVLLATLSGAVPLAWLEFLLRSHAPKTPRRVSPRAG